MPINRLRLEQILSFIDTRVELGQPNVLNCEKLFKAILDKLA